MNKKEKNRKTNFIKRHRHLLVMVITFITVITVLSPFVVWETYELAFRNEIYPGIQITSDRLQVTREKTIKITAKEKEWMINGEDLGVEIDQEKTQEKLMAIGRSGNLIEDLKVKIKAYKYGLEVDPVITYQEEKLTEITSKISAELNVPTQEPKFKLAGGRVIEFQIGINGQTVDQSTLKDYVIKAIYTEGDQNIEVPIQIVQPNNKNLDKTADELGIKQLLGAGTSTYKGSIPSRKHNVILTAQKLDGILIAPGSEFSFNNTIGDVSKETGYESAYIIQDGRTVLGDGGGVCQGSTTLFRAAMSAGLPIIERRAHSYRVGYYEQNSPPGLDATVFSPTTDFKFKNDTPGYLLIQTYADSAGSALKIEIWGTGDGRVAVTSKPIVTDQIPPPADLYQDDPTLKTGVIKQVDWKAWGAKVRFDYTVTRNGETILKKTYVSNYQPWGAVFLRGTGG